MKPVGKDMTVHKPAACLISLESIEGLVRVANEGQAHFRLLLFRHRASLSTVRRTGVFLRDFIDREVGNINIRGESWFERRTDLAQLIPYHSAEERVILDLGRTAVLATFITNTMFGIA